MPATAVCRILALSLGLVAAGAAAQTDPSDIMAVPNIDWGWEMLEVRDFAQRQTVDRFEVPWEFRFTDRLAESGITFAHVSTPDSGKFYQPNHYDHGNGVLVADIDGDDKLDLYLLSQLGPNGLYRNLGGGRFEDVTAAAGVALADRLSVTGAFADYDNDGDPDLFVTTVKMGNVLFDNDGTGRFTDVTERAGLGYVGHSSGAVFFDYDRDGLLDLFVTNVGVYTLDQLTTSGYWAGIDQTDPGGSAFNGHLNPSRSERSILYRNRGDGTFEDVSEKTGLIEDGWNGDASAVDVDGDGWIDLYVTNMQGDDAYWRNVGGERFEDKTADVFPKSPWGAMGIKFFDWNNDGRLDLYLTDMHSDMSRKVTPGYEKLKSLMVAEDAQLQGGANNVFGNAFWEQGADGTWSERSDAVGLENYWPWGPTIGDLNSDGYQDVFIASSMNFPYRYGVNSVLLNNAGGGFLDAEFLVGVEPRQTLTERPWYHPERPWLVTKKPWFVLECSGADQPHPLCRGRSGTLTVMANVGTRSAALFDLDDDGDVDIVTNEFNEVPQVLINDLSERRPTHFLKVRLVGGASNRDGFGARVRVVTADRTLTQVHDGQSGYLSHSSMPLYFGLGDDPGITSVEVLWPSGTVQVVTDALAADRLIEIAEP